MIGCLVCLYEWDRSEITLQGLVEEKSFSRLLGRVRRLEYWTAHGELLIYHDRVSSQSRITSLIVSVIDGHIVALASQDHHEASKLGFKNV